jgi:hypothetical protein
MATLTPNSIVATGLTVPAFSSPGSGGDTFANDGRTFLEARTAGTASTVTITTPNSIGGLGIADQTVVLAATATAMIGPFPPALYNDSAGNVGLSYNGTAGLTLGVFRLP